MLLVRLLVVLSVVSALNLAELRYRSIYQVLTDRFALADDQRFLACDVGRKEYCGGSWKGIEGKLQYIQGMGFDTSE